MATGYEVQMYNDVRSIASSLERIANHLQATEMRRRDAENQSRAEASKLLDEIKADMEIDVPKDPLDGLSFGDLNDLEGHSEWKLAVTRDETILGYTQWRAWKASSEPNNV